ncbi:hypothetical protein ACSNOJ_34010 [Streptomyces sp. URMC 128]|uniref:hypothetical protein n=1 Tax=Streptomyces sp. URMC 128 TaxID=3423404 RepID=UPI003F1B4B49
MDTVLKVEPSGGDGFLIALEAQTARAPGKGCSWSYYVAYLHAKFGMPVLLVAVCKDLPTASWAAGPFECRVGTWTTQPECPRHTEHGGPRHAGVGQGNSEILVRMA